MLTHQKFQRQVKQLREAGARFLGLSVLEAREGEFDLKYFFDLQGETQVLLTRTEHRSAPSLIGSYAFCDFPERDAYRQYRIKFLGNPNLPTEGPP